jgi:DNA ligase-1
MEKRMNNEVKLYRKNQLGIGTWRIWYEVHDDEHATLHYAHASVMGGAEIFHKDVVTTNMSGRRILEQVQLELRSRVSRQMDKGYKATIEEAREGSTNQLGLINPMLAQPLERVGVPRDLRNAYVQRKYDGHRTLITNFNGDIFAYTRRGKPITTIDHILTKIGKWLPEGATLDGELYIHGQPLQNISSIIKRAQPANAKLQFHWYDLVDRQNPSYTFHRRYQRMQELYVPGDTYELVPTYPVGCIEEAMDYFKEFRREKYEGAMLRLDTKPYQDAVRSSSIIKLKEWDTIDGTCVGIRPSREGWAICRVKLDNGKEFDASAPGSVPEKTEVLKNPDKYLGRRMELEYSTLTSDGIPFHASAMRWLDEL